MKLGISWEVKQNLVASIALGVFAFVFSLRDKPGSDIEIGRNHLLEGTGNNLLGAWSSWFYSIFPNSFVSWHVSLILFQIALSTLGVFLTISSLNAEENTQNKISFYVFAYFIIDFASQQSRDGTMMALTIFAIGLWRFASKTKNLKVGSTLKKFAIAITIFAFAFRPWLAFSLISFFLLLRKDKRNRTKKIILIILILIAPIAIENIAFKVLDLDNWYPQQTVMIHDLVATYCWNTSLSTRETAWEGLDSLATSNLSKREVCQAFKPNTWQAVVADGVSTDSGSPPLRTIEGNNDLEYEEIKSHWIRAIVSDPFSYIQNHLMFSTQVLIAGDMRGISLFSTKEKDVYSIARSVWKLPSDMAKTLHLTSPVIALMFYVFSRKKILKKTKSIQEFDLSAAILTVWIGITSIGYVSDNGRYTLVPVLILYLILITKIRSVSDFKNRDNFE
ncbi:hypothetical protein MCEGKSH29_00036 [Candidatus Nanopelagicaceae bacterium]